jgi:ribonuclease P protein component
MTSRPPRASGAPANIDGWPDLTGTATGALLCPRHEAHLPAAQHPPGTHPRFPGSHVHAWRPESAAESSPQGTQAPRPDHLQEVGGLNDRVTRTLEREGGSGGIWTGHERRLRKHREFVYAQRSGRRVGTPHFTLLVAAQPPPPRPARLGIVVARRVGGAVLRNRVKRLCRECFRTLPQLLPHGVDLVVIAREGAPALGIAEVRAEWRAVGTLLARRASPPSGPPSFRPPRGRCIRPETTARSLTHVCQPVHRARKGLPARAFAATERLRAALPLRAVVFAVRVDLPGGAWRAAGQLAFSRAAV